MRVSADVVFSGDRLTDAVLELAALAYKLDYRLSRGSIVFVVTKTQLVQDFYNTMPYLYTCDTAMNFFPR